VLTSVWPDLRDLAFRPTAAAAISSTRRYGNGEVVESKAQARGAGPLAEAV
jgi:hypothetical protein